MGRASGRCSLHGTAGDTESFSGGGLSDLSIDCAGLASEGISLISGSSVSYKRIYVFSLTAHDIYFGTRADGIFIPNYVNSLEDINILALGPANGFVLDGTPGSGTNTCFTSAHRLHFTFEDGCAFAICNGDDNYFYSCGASRVTGKSGTAIWFGGSSDGSGKVAHANFFYGVYSDAPISYGGGTSPSRGNYVHTSAMDMMPIVYAAPGAVATTLVQAGEPGLNGFVRGWPPAG